MRDTLAQRGREQIEREGGLLTALTDMARALQQAIGQSATAGWAVALRLQQDMAQHAVTMHEQRMQWRAETAADIGIAPDEVTLSAIAARIGGTAETDLLAARDRLRGQLQEFARLNSFNLLLVRAHLEALRRFFLDLTGAGESAGRYDRTGAGPGPAHGGLVHTKG
jgi:hypothetical protein